MPRKQASTTDSIIFNGITFRRYPLSERADCRNYYRCDGRFRKHGIAYLHHEVWKFYNGEIPEGYHVHHKDGNTLNNDISNLEILAGYDHLSLHGKQRWQDEDARAKGLEQLDAIRPLTKEWHKSDAGHEWHVEHGKRVAAEQARRSKKIVVCEQCGNLFEVAPFVEGRARFCSDKCYAKYRRDNGIDDETRTCAICGKEFRCNKYSKKKTCSRSCGAKSMVLARAERNRLQHDG